MSIIIPNPKTPWQFDDWMYYEDQTRRIYRKNKTFQPDKRIYNVWGHYGIGKSSFISYALAKFQFNTQSTVLYFTTGTEYISIDGGAVAEELRKFLFNHKYHRGSLIDIVESLTNLVIHLHVEVFVEYECGDAELLRNLAKYPNVYIFIESINDLGESLQSITNQTNVVSIEVLGIKSMKTFHQNWTTKDKLISKSIFKNKKYIEHFLDWTGNHPLFYQWLRHRAESTRIQGRTPQSIIMRIVETHWHEIAKHVESFIASLPRTDQIRLKEIFYNDDHRAFLTRRDYDIGIAVEYKPKDNDKVVYYLSKILEWHLQSPFTFMLYNDSHEPVGCAFVVGRKENKFIVATSIRALLQATPPELADYQTIILHDKKTGSQIDVALDTYNDTQVNVTNNIDSLRELKHVDRNDLDSFLNSSLKPQDEIRFLTIPYTDVASKVYKAWDFQQDELRTEACEILALTDIGPQWLNQVICQEVNIALTDNNPIRLLYHLKDGSLPPDRITLLPGSPVVSSDQKVIGMVRSKVPIYGNRGVQMIPVPRLRPLIQRFLGNLES